MKKQKLQLKRTTVHQMSASDLTAVNGGQTASICGTCPATGFWCPIGTIGPIYTTAC